MRGVIVNRIYQGRVGRVEISQGKKKSDQADGWSDMPGWVDALWSHHALFQDAVNYYVIALLALAHESNDRIFPIRRRLAEVDEEGKPTDNHVWTRVRRRGTSRLGMRESVARYLGLDEATATPEDCFKKILSGNASDPKLLDLALRELLAECGGDGAIKQAGPWMLPRFCWSGYSGSYPKSRTQLDRASKEKRLARELHKLESDKAREKFAAEVELSWVVNINENREPHKGAKAKERLQKAVSHFWQVFGGTASTKLGDRARSFLDSSKDAGNQLAQISKQLSAMENDNAPVIPKNRKSIPDRTEALLLFKYFPSLFTHELLKVSFPYKEQISSQNKDSIQDPFLKFGDDPIKLARGKRGYVFPAFTCLECWGDKDQGELVWKEFDIEAFEEALKVLHQVEAKGEERDKERKKLERRLACMHGEIGWKPSKEEEEDAPPAVLKGDPRVERLERILDSDLAQEYELTEGQSVTYGLRPRTIRGFRDLRAIWDRIAPEGTTPTDAIQKRLSGELRSYQRENAYSVGSVKLFEELLKPGNWIIWQQPSIETLKSWRKATGLKDDVEFALDPVAVLTEARQMEREIERLQEPIRFTPADPRYSRRQFYFSNVCSFTERGKYRHERNSQSVIVPMAVRQDGIFEVRSVRLHYSAPRLFRDNLRASDDENLKTAPFLQPMMEALDIPNEMSQDISGHAVALMPEVLSSGEKRILLNFPISLDTAPLADRVCRRQIWEKQFASYGDKNMYLRWPELTSGIKVPSQGWWWEKVDSFSCMPVDLGQRDAGAFAVLDRKSVV